MHARRLLSPIELMAAVSIVCSAQVAIKEYPVPTNQTYLRDGIKAGPDGNLWFFEGNGIKIAKMTVTGVILAEYPIPNPGIYNNGSGAGSLAVGPDGNIWFPQYFANSIGRITPAGVITEFPLPTPFNFPAAITAGPDGNMWFTEYFFNKIGRITPSGQVTEFVVPSGGLEGATEITLGPDGNLWFTNCRCSGQSSGQTTVGKITPGGQITEFTLPAGSQPYGIAAGSDGNLWVAEFSANRIARITPSGQITEFPIPTPASGPYGIAAGPDGNLWFTEANGNNLGRITTAGAITEFPIPAAGSVPLGITLGPDGNLWFVESTAKQLGQVILVPRGAFQLKYFNTNYGSGQVIVSNAGTMSTGGNPADDSSGTICANFYSFDPNEEMQTCCSCPVTPNGLSSLNVIEDIVSQNLITNPSGAITVKALFSKAARDGGGNVLCDAAQPTVETLAGGGVAWGTNLRNVTFQGSPPTTVKTTTETRFSHAELSVAELTKLTTYCRYVKILGSQVKGICKSCQAGARGGIGRQ